MNAKHRTEKIKERVPAQLNKKKSTSKQNKKKKNMPSKEMVKQIAKDVNIWILLDAEGNIKRRKALAIATYNKQKNILETKSTSMKTKIKILKVYIESVFLYNSELWTLTNLLVKEIDIFQRGVIKKIFNTHLQDKITNMESIEDTNSNLVVNLSKNT